MKQNSSTQTEEKSSKLAPKQMNVIFLQELRFTIDLAFLEFVCLRSVAKWAIWKFLNNELAHYFRFFNRLKEMKACFQNSLLKKAEKIAFESQIIKKMLMAVLGFRKFD